MYPYIMWIEMYYSNINANLIPQIYPTLSAKRELKPTMFSR